MQRQCSILLLYEMAASPGQGHEAGTADLAKSAEQLGLAFV